MKVLIESNNLLALLAGNVKNKVAMKDRVRKGYNGDYSQHVTQYDEIAGELKKRAAAYQLYKCDFQGICLNRDKTKQRVWDMTLVRLNSVNWMLKLYLLRITVSM